MDIVMGHLKLYNILEYYISLHYFRTQGYRPFVGNFFPSNYFKGTNQVILFLHNFDAT